MSGRTTVDVRLQERPGRRILVVAPQPFLMDRGTPIATACLLEALSRLGYEVDVLTYPMGRDVRVPNVTLHRIGNPFGMKEVPIGFSLRKVALDTGMMVALRRLVRSRSYAAIHAIEEAAALAVMLRPAGVPVIYDMQSSLAEQLGNLRLLSSRWARRWLDLGERWLLGRVDQVVCSAGLAERVRRAVPGARVREWWFPGLPVAAPDEAAKLRRSLGIPDDARVAVYTGSFASYQGLDVLLAAVPEIARRVPGFRLVLVGGDAGSRIRVERAAREVGVDGAVIVRERVARCEIAPYLGLADVLVAPRARGSNLPLKYFDYLATGKPIVLAGRYPGLRDAPGRVVLVDHAADAIADAAVRVLASCDSAAGDRAVGNMAGEICGRMQGQGEAAAQSEADARVDADARDAAALRVEAADGPAGAVVAETPGPAPAPDRVRFAEFVGELYAAAIGSPTSEGAVHIDGSEPVDGIPATAASDGIAVPDGIRASVGATAPAGPISSEGSVGAVVTAAGFSKALDAAARAGSAETGNADPCPQAPASVSVIIPARNEAGRIGATVRAVLQQRCPVPVEVVVVDDGSSDATAHVAEAAGARVVRRDGGEGRRGGNPGAARNLGVRASSGELIVFLDADCRPEPGWLQRHLEAHAAGERVVGGSLSLPPGTGWLGRCEYFGCWYMAHPVRAAGPVPNHPPANLSVRRSVFEATSGFAEDAPVCDGHEELRWQAELGRAGIRIHFEPAARVAHAHEGTPRSLLERAYRWGYSALQAKAESGAARLAAAYRHPALLILAALPLAFAHTLFLVGTWLRAGRLGVIAAIPVLLATRLAYAAGMTIGGLRWLRARKRPGLLRPGAASVPSSTSVGREGEAAVGERGSGDESKWSEATVAICTRNRRSALTRALRSVFAQRVAPGEVLVVDNGSPDEGIRQAVEAEFPGVRYVREPCPGLDFARNAALWAATGEVVVFLDDDAVADGEWLAALRSRFAADPTLAACTGRVSALSFAPVGARIFEANGGFPGGDRPVTLPHDARTSRLHGLRAPLIAWAVSFGSGCNLAVRRRAALEIGGFDEALDLGAELPAGGDSDLIWRLLRAGYSTGYEPAAIVRHAHRATAEEAYDQILGHQRGFMAFLGKSLAAARGASALPVLAYVAWRLIKPGVRLARRALGRDPLPAGVLLRLARAAWSGLFTYPAARRIAERRRRLRSAPETMAIAG